MVNVNANDIQSDQDLNQRFERPVPGWYHVVITRVDESEQEYPGKIVVDFKVHAGTVPGQEGRTLREFFATSEASRKRLVKLAIALGLLNYRERKEVQFSEALGRQLVIEVEPSTYKKRDGTQVESTRCTFLGLYTPDDERVKDVPKDPELMNLCAPNSRVQSPLDVTADGSAGEATAGEDGGFGGEADWYADF